MVTVYSLNS